MQSRCTMLKHALFISTPYLFDHGMGFLPEIYGIFLKKMTR